MTTPSPFYLDCDTGPDDALALAYLLAAPSAEVVGIGTVSGNVSVAVGVPDGIAMFEEKFGDGAPAQIADRTRQALHGIPVTLAAIKQIAESIAAQQQFRS